MSGAHCTAFLCRLTVAALPMLAGCDALWGGLVKDNPQHCEKSPEVCTGGEVCNPESGLCAPALVLDAVSPLRLPGAGGRATVQGSGFDAGTTVLFDGVAAVVESFTATTLTVSVPQNPQGHWRVPVRVQRGFGPAVTRSDVFSYYAENISFLNDSQGSRPQDNVVIADWNHDGFVDILFSDVSGKDLRMLAGQANGSLSLPSVVRLLPGVGTGTAFLRSADFDGDGQVELLVGGDYGTHVLVNPKSPTLRTLSTMKASCAVVADLDSDGDIDILLGDQRGLSALLNDGQGGFADLLAISATQPLDVAAVPSKGAGSSELYALAPTQVASYRFVSRSMVQSRSPIGIDGSQCTPLGLAAAFLGSESLPHLLVSCDQGLLRYTPDASGAYPSKDFLVSGFGVGNRILPADYNGDGRLDLFLVDVSGRRALLEKAATNGDNTYSQTVLTQFPSAFSSTIGADVGDLDGDGKPDVAVTVRPLSGPITVLRNRSQ